MKPARRPTRLRSSDRAPSAASGLDPGLQARRRAVQRLSRRDHSEGEIRRLLSRDGYPGDVVEATVRALREQSYLDDAALASRFARSRLAHQGLGRHRIRAELKRRGVSRAIIDQGLTRALEDVPEATALEAVASRYWRAHRSDPPAQRARKLWAFLMRRGFPPALVRDRLRSLWPRWREAAADVERESSEE